MLEKLNSDRSFINEKYHKATDNFNGYNRFAYHGWDADFSTGKSDEQILEALEKLSQQLNGAPHHIAKARAFEYILDNAPIEINEHDYFIYFYSVGRLTSKSFFNKWNAESVAQMPEPYAQIEEFNASGALTQWPDYDHTIPCWDDLLSLGISGIIKRAEHYRLLHKQNGTLTDDMDAFYEGIIISYNAWLRLMKRYISYAESHENSKSEAVKQCIESLYSGAPKTFYEALQLMYIYFILSEHIDGYQCRSLGHGLDSTLYRFYKSDLESGKYTQDELAEYLGYFFMQFSAIGNYWGQPLYLGGTNFDGTTKYNELSYFILDVYDKLGIYNPKIQLKVNESTPDRLLDTALEMVRRKNASIVFSCEPGMLKAMAVYGVPFEEAYDYDISGCYETRVKDNETSTTTGYVNALKAVRLVLTRGVDEHSGKQIGVDTGEIEKLTDFTMFHKAFLKQWTYLIECVITNANMIDKNMAFVNPANIFSGTSQKAVERGLDGYSLGVDYNNSSLLNCGIGTAIDALMAVKEFVYDTHFVTVTQMAEAIKNNWKGYEELRARVLHSKKKYGNGIPEVDRYANVVSRYFADYVNNRPNGRGGVYKAIMHSAMQFVWQGSLTGATPDGRCDGEEISKNASCTNGMEHNGITALMKSALALEPTLYPESFCLDVMLHPSAVTGEDGLTAMRAMVLAYMRGNGQSMQFNICSAETLRDAQAHPEKYGDLQIRVCGWNVLWNNIPKAQQDAYIKRAESI